MCFCIQKVYVYYITTGIKCIHFRIKTPIFPLFFLTPSFFYLVPENQRWGFFFALIFCFTLQTLTIQNRQYEHKKRAKHSENPSHIVYSTFRHLVGTKRYTCYPLKKFIQLTCYVRELFRFLIYPAPGDLRLRFFLYQFQCAPAAFHLDGLLQLFLRVLF